jgi:Skp family chaperone for outer membrane proteins
MNLRLVLSLVLAIVCLPILGSAQAPTAAAPPATPATIGPAKIAWLGLEQAIFSCEEGKREFGEVQKFVEKKNSELENMKKELDTLRNQLSVQGAKLTDEARADLEEQIDVKDTSLQRFQQDTQKEIDSRRVRVTNYVGRRMLPVLEKIAKEKGLSAILYVSPSRDAWIDPGLLITEEVVKAYNQAYPGGGAKSPAAAPEKKP